MKLIVLAAGKGKRLMSESRALPKALRQANGIPLIKHVLANTSFVDPSDTTIVVGYRKDQVIEELGDKYNYAEQVVVDGTAHATEYAKQNLEGYEGIVMVVYCDMPLLTTESYKAVLNRHIETKADHTLLAGIVDPPPAFGRLIRDKDGRLTGIIEDSACDAAQKAITEVNIGVQVFNAPEMWDMLAAVPYDETRNPPERYLTAATSVYAAKGKKIEVAILDDFDESLGVNTEEDLARVEAILAARQI